MDDMLMGTLPRQFADGNCQSIVIQVTEDCNLRCKYCYMTGKNEFKRLSFDTAMKIVDYVLSLESEHDAVAWEFIGGDPSLEMDLIDKIADYAKLRMFELNHKWFEHYIFNIGTNGILYDSDKFQHFLKKNAEHVTVSITIDGTKEKHDLQRVKKDGSGSYDDVVRNIPLWLSQIPAAATKVTFASEDLKYLSESILHLWKLGLKNIPANVVFEDVWKERDDTLFEQQLKELADYIIDSKCWKDHSVRFFDRNLGFPLGHLQKSKNFCGSGRLLAFDCDGNIFPCVRFYDICQSEQTLCLGNLDTGIDSEKRALLSKTCIGIVNDEECASCSIASGCFSCAGNNYRYTSPHSIYKRTKYNCKMHKANVKVNEYFWDRWIMQNDQPSPHELERKRAFQIENWKLDGAQYLYFLLSDNETSFCNYASGITGVRMTQEVFDQAVQYAYENHMIPVYIGDPTPFFTTYSRNKLHVRIERYSEHLNEINSVEVIIPIFDSENYQLLNHNIDSCILRIESSGVSKYCTVYKHLKKYAHSIRTVIPNFWTWDSKTSAAYLSQLKQIRSSYNQADSLMVRDDCRAGITEFAICPDGKIYPCPGYYFKHINSLGDCVQGISTDFASLVDIHRSLDCLECNHKECQRCSLANTVRHGMPNIPAKVQCEFNLHVT